MDTGAMSVVATNAFAVSAPGQSGVGWPRAQLWPRGVDGWGKIPVTCTQRQESKREAEAHGAAAASTRVKHLANQEQRAAEARGGHPLCHQPGTCAAMSQNHCKRVTHLLTCRRVWQGAGGGDGCGDVSLVAYRTQLLHFSSSPTFVFCGAAPKGHLCLPPTQHLVSVLWSRLHHNTLHSQTGCTSLNFRKDVRGERDGVIRYWYCPVRNVTLLDASGSALPTQAASGPRISSYTNTAKWAQIGAPHFALGDEVHKMEHRGKQKKPCLQCPRLV